MLARRIVAFAIALLSVGWLVPLWIALDNYLHFWEQPGIELLSRGETNYPGMGGGPAVLFMITREYFTIATVWLAVVGTCWAYLGALTIIRHLRPNNALERTREE
jgi:hypothetical protein